MGQQVLIRDNPGDFAVPSDSQPIGDLRPGDIVEFVPFVTEPDGTVRPSWLASDARPDELRVPP